MPRYLINQFISTCYQVVIDAEDEEEAQDIAEQIDVQEMRLHFEQLDFWEINEIPLEEQFKAPLFKQTKEGFEKI